MQRFTRPFEAGHDNVEDFLSSKVFRQAAESVVRLLYIPCLAGYAREHSRADHAWRAAE